MPGPRRTVNGETREWDGQRWTPLDGNGMPMISLPPQHASGRTDAQDLSSLKNLLTTAGSFAPLALAPEVGIPARVGMAALGGLLGRVTGHGIEAASPVGRNANASLLEDAGEGALAGGAAEILPTVIGGGLKYGGKAANALGAFTQKPGLYAGTAALMHGDPGTAAIAMGGPAALRAGGAGAEALGEKVGTKTLSQRLQGAKGWLQDALSGESAPPVAPSASAAPGGRPVAPAGAPAGAPVTPRTPTTVPYSPPLTVTNPLTDLATEPLPAAGLAGNASGNYAPITRPEGGWGEPAAVPTPHPAVSGVTSAIEDTPASAPAAAAEIREPLLEAARQQMGIPERPMPESWQSGNEADPWISRRLAETNARFTGEALPEEPPVVGPVTRSSRDLSPAVQGVESAIADTPDPANLIRNDSADRLAHTANPLVNLDRSVSDQDLLEQVAPQTFRGRADRKYAQAVQDAMAEQMPRASAPDGPVDPIDPDVFEPREDFLTRYVQARNLGSNRVLNRTTGSAIATAGLAEALRRMSLSNDASAGSQ